MILVLVVVGLAFTRRQVTSSKAAKAPLLTGPLYAVLFLVAAALAYLWH